MKFIILCLGFTLISQISAENITRPGECQVCQSIKDQIKQYTTCAYKIMNAIVHGGYKGTTYEHLAAFIDKFGSRFTGTQNLENAIDYMINKSLEFNLENVRVENVTVPQWVRGKESAAMVEPRAYNLTMLGLGYSVGTPKDGIRAQVIVVRGFDELHKKGEALVKGKIVVFDEKFISYGETVKYRTRGASEAAKLGAVAALINSVTPLSLNTPHTGMQTYYPNVTKIPVACITSSDAHMLRRMQNRADKIVVVIKMEAQMLEPKISRNTVIEIVGKTQPEKVVLLSGHIDSWDVGQGAMDDGGGVFISWNSLVILKKLGFRPKRTIRTILWTGEEMGLIGAEAYVKNHAFELENFNFVMESDIGTFWPTGLAVTANDEAFCIIKEVMTLTQPLSGAAMTDKGNSSWVIQQAPAGLLKPLNATLVCKGANGPDIMFFLNMGIPGASLLNKNERYCIYHHTAADTMDIENTVALDYATAIWTTFAFIIADLDTDIPKDLKIYI